MARKGPGFDGKELARKRCPGGQRTEVCAYYVCGHFGAARRMFADENRTGPGEKEFAQSGGDRPRQPAEYRYQGRNRIRTASDPFGRSRASFAAPSGGWLSTGRRIARPQEKAWPGQATRRQCSIARE